MRVLPRFGRELLRREPVLARCAALCFGCLGVLMLLIPFDDRTVTGAPVWLKPAKFAASIGLYLATLAWLFGELPTRRRLLRWLAVVIAAAMLLEQLLITLQAARGTTSHYNFTTAFDAAVFQAMAGGIVVNTAAAGVVLLLFLLHADRRRPAWLWGIRAGLAIFLLGSLEGFAMTARGAHTVGAPDGGPGLPLLQWSSVAGDLRIAHFLAIHALQILPLAGLLIDRLRGPRPLRCGLVLGAAIAYAVLVAAAYLQARAGRPLL